MIKAATELCPLCGKEPGSTSLGLCCWCDNTQGEDPSREYLPRPWELHRHPDGFVASNRATHQLILYRTRTFGQAVACFMAQHQQD